MPAVLEAREKDGQRGAGACGGNSATWGWAAARRRLTESDDTDWQSGDRGGGSSKAFTGGAAEHAQRLACIAG